MPQCPLPQPLVAFVLFFVPMIFPILDPSYNWNHKILSFCPWFIWLSIMFSGFIYVVVCIRISFLF